MGSKLADLGRASPALTRTWGQIMDENRARRQEAIQSEELAMKREAFGQQQAIGKLRLQREQMEYDAAQKQKAFNERLVHWETLPQIRDLSGPTKNKIKEDLETQKVINEHGYGQIQAFTEFQKTHAGTTQAMKPYVDIELKALHQETSDAQDKLAKELGKGEFRDAKKVEELRTKYSAASEKETRMANDYDTAVKIETKTQRIKALADQIMRMEGKYLSPNDPFGNQIMLSLQGGDWDKAETALMERLKSDLRQQEAQAKPTAPVTEYQKESLAQRKEQTEENRLSREQMHRDNMAFRKDLFNLQKTTKNRLPASSQKDINEKVTKLDQYAELIDSFKDEYGGSYIGGPTMTGIYEKTGYKKERVGWWKEWKLMDSKLRQEVFGATLSPTEKQSWDAITINENTDPQVARDTMRMRLRIAKDALDRHVEGFTSAGWDVNAPQPKSPKGSKFKILKVE